VNHVPPAAELLAENVKLQNELLAAHALLRRFASGNYNFRVLRSLCEEAEALVNRARLIYAPPANSYAELDSRLGVNRREPLCPHVEPAEDCAGCRDMGWSGSGER
jgi:hypothetical protein